MVQDDALGDMRNLASRAIAVARERRLSTRELSSRLKAEGCDMPHNALKRVQRGYRALTWDEAVALSRVLGLDIKDIGTELPFLNDTRAKGAITRVGDRVSDLFAASAAVVVAYREFLALLDEQGQDDGVTRELLSRVQRRVRALEPVSRTSDEVRSFQAVRTCLDELVSVAVEGRYPDGLTTLEELVGSTVDLVRVAPTLPADEVPQPAPEYQSLLDFAESDPEGFAQFARVESEAFDAAFGAALSDAERGELDLVTRQRNNPSKERHGER